MFKHEVHEPMMMVLQPTDYTAHLEKVIGRNDLEAFVCEDPDDANLLMNTLRKQERLKRINVATSSPNTNDQFRNPLKDIPKGFKVKFLNEVLGPCPPAIKNHLCQKHKLHNIPVFEQDPGTIIEELPKYFFKFTIFVNKRSNYAKDTFTSTDYIDTPDKNKYLKDNHASDGTGDNLEEKLEETLRFREQIETRISKSEALQQDK